MGYQEKNQYINKFPDISIILEVYREILGYIKKKQIISRNRHLSTISSSLSKKKWTKNARSNFRVNQ